MGLVVAFGCYLVAAAVLTVLPHDRTADATLLVAIAGAVGWRTTIPGSLCVGVLGWPFYSGFVTHTHGQLGIVGVQDATVLAVLVLTALGVVALRTVLRWAGIPARCPIRTTVLLPGAEIPGPRRPVEDTRRRGQPGGPAVRRRRHEPCDPCAVPSPLRIGYFSSSAVLAAADDLLAAHGLAVHAEPVRSSAAQFRSLADGAYDLVLTSPDNVAAYRFGDHNPLGERLDVRIVRAVDGGLGLALLAAADVRAPAELRGRRVGVDVPESGFAFWLYDFLAAHGLRRDTDYEVVALGATPRRAVALREGRCDATLLYGGLTIAARTAGFVVLGRLSEHVRPYLATVLAGSAPWLDAHADEVARLDTVWRLAVHRLLDPAEDSTRDAVLERTFELTGAAVDELRAVLRDRHEGLVRDGVVDPAALDNVLALRARHGRPGAVADLTAALAAAGGSVSGTGIIDQRGTPADGR